MVFPLKWSPILKGPDMSASVYITPLTYQQDPLAYFSALRHRPGAVLLDSGSPHAPGGRYDILSCDPRSILTVDRQGAVLVDGMRQSSNNPFTVQQALLDSLQLEVPESTLPFLGGLIGYWSYDLGRILEPVGEAAPDILGLPLCRSGLYDWALIQDHHEQRSWLVASQARRGQVLEWLRQPASPTADFQLTDTFASELDQDGYARRFAAVQHYIRAGDCYQINLAQRFSARYHGDLWQAYQHLRQATPTPFSGFMAWPDTQGEQAILSLSPERFLRCHADGHVEARPIKGTRPRGDTPAADQHLAEELITSPKDRAENVMIVDLLRNDLGRVCRPGSVRVPQLCQLESYANVHHLVSVVCGQLAQGQRPLDLLAAAFPGGSITGAPKVRSMQVIDELEPSRRGPYCGSLGYIDVRGEMDTSITIRTAVADGERLHLWGGGGLVADSDVIAEYHETLDKIRHLMGALSKTHTHKK